MRIHTECHLKSTMIQMVHDLYLSIVEMVEHINKNKCQVNYKNKIIKKITGS